MLFVAPGLMFVGLPVDWEASGRYFYTIVTFLGLYQECAGLYQEKRFIIAVKLVVGTA